MSSDLAHAGTPWLPMKRKLQGRFARIEMEARKLARSGQDRWSHSIEMALLARGYRDAPRVSRIAGPNASWIALRTGDLCGRGSDHRLSVNRRAIGTPQIGIRMEPLSPTFRTIRARAVGAGRGCRDGTGVMGHEGTYPASMRTPTLAFGDHFICRHCGALYLVRYAELPIADSGSVYCEVCRRQMIQWNSSQEPSFKLMKRPDPK
jgi:hypothetical protein